VRHGRRKPGVSEWPGLRATSGASRIGGLLDGPAWQPVGERLATDPYFTQKVCAVSIAQ
jgi:hypothetical protein